MAAGDIILSNGTAITAEDIAVIASQVKTLLAQQSKDLTQYESVNTLNGVTSLPGLQVSGNTQKLVRVAISALKGTDGKQLEMSSSSTAIQWRYVGDTLWNTLVSLSLLKGEKVMLRKGNPGIEWKYENDENWQTLVPLSDLFFSYEELTDEQKQEISKKPILSAVEATAGDTASGSFVSDGLDTDGNPKYKLVVVLPKGDKGNPGDTGKTPVLEAGTVTTLEPTQSVTAELVANGTDASGNPKYKLNLGIPRGDGVTENYMVWG